LVLKCSHCLHFDWYSLDEVAQTFACHRCRTTTVITEATWRGGTEPVHYYDLAEVVYQAVKGNVEVPVRALALLQAGTKSFAEMPEVELTNSSDEQIEIDLLAIADGGILIGEAKTGDRLRKTKAAELDWHQFGSVAREATVDQVVFATGSAMWRPETSLRIRREFG